MLQSLGCQEFFLSLDDFRELGRGLNTSLVDGELGWQRERSLQLRSFWVFLLLFSPWRSMGVLKAGSPTGERARGWLGLHMCPALLANLPHLTYWQEWLGTGGRRHTGKGWFWPEFGAGHSCLRPRIQRVPQGMDCLGGRKTGKAIQHSIQVVKAWCVTLSQKSFKIVSQQRRSQTDSQGRTYCNLWTRAREGILVQFTTVGSSPVSLEIIR